MNFRNIYQDEVQSAYWQVTQTSIHAVINYFSCPNSSCSENVTLILAQITDDLQHDSFLARTGHDAAFRYLAEIGVPMNVMFQFCDNCSSQYKSHHPFAELARCPLNVIRVYFDEQHGKSMCDGFFGRLKSWMTYKIKTRKFVNTNAHDFFRSCKEEYETAAAEPGQCQHYRVVFQFLRPSDIRRHHDCDLDEAIPGTRSFYSVRNTPHPLKLKVRNIPCLCTHCVTDSGQVCENANYTDPWRDVDLVPVKGQNKKKHMKRKHPSEYVSVQRARNHLESEDNNDNNDDDPIPDFVFPEANAEKNDVVDLTSQQNEQGSEVFMDLTEGCTDDVQDGKGTTSEPLEVNDVILENEVQITGQNLGVLDLDAVDEYIPDRIYWETILRALE